MKLAIALVLVAGCVFDGGQGDDVELGVIDFYGDGPQIDLTTSARAGAPIIASVTTYGGGCVHEVRTDVDVGADRVAIYPFDSKPPASATCTADLRLYEHLATFSFASPGTKTIEVHGRRTSSDGDETIVIPLSIEITP